MAPGPHRSIPEASGGLPERIEVAVPVRILTGTTTLIVSRTSRRRAGLADWAGWARVGLGWGWAGLGFSWAGWGEVGWYRFGQAGVGWNERAELLGLGWAGWLGWLGGLG